MGEGKLAEISERNLQSAIDARDEIVESIRKNMRRSADD